MSSICELLRDAIAKKSKNAAHTKQDKHLDPLRQREDFKKLLAELEGKSGTLVRSTLLRSQKKTVS